MLSFNEVLEAVINMDFTSRETLLGILEKHQSEERNGSKAEKSKLTAKDYEAWKLKNSLALDVKKSHQEISELGNKIMFGMELSFQKLLEQKIKEDGEFVFSENGTVVHVKAREFKKQSKL